METNGKKIDEKKSTKELKRKYYPPIRTDEKGIIKMAEVGLSIRGIAYIVGCDEKTIRNKYADKIEKGKAKTGFRIAEKMIDLALEGDRTMLIWVSKNILGWTDTAQMPSNQVLTVLKQTINTNASGEVEIKSESKEIESE